MEIVHDESTFPNLAKFVDRHIPVGLPQQTFEQEALAGGDKKKRCIMGMKWNEYFAAWNANYSDYLVRSIWRWRGKCPQLLATITHAPHDAKDPCFADESVDHVRSTDSFTYLPEMSEM